MVFPAMNGFGPQTVGTPGVANGGAPGITQFGGKKHKKMKQAINNLEAHQQQQDQQIAQQAQQIQQLSQQMNALTEKVGYLEGRLDQMQADKSSAAGMAGVGQLQGMLSGCQDQRADLNQRAQTYFRGFMDGDTFAHVEDLFGKASLSGDPSAIGDRLRQGLLEGGASGPFTDVACGWFAARVPC
jgi:hypothetical protein